jgi:hypothetical protein
VRDIEIYKNVHGKDELKDALRRTWERIEPPFTDRARLDATYRDRYWAQAPPYDGHWVAFHLLEHDLHHRAEILLYLAMLGVQVPSEWTWVSAAD